jgi:uncharacterized protein (DUF427 family)
MPVQQAIWKDTVIAESDRTVVVEGNHYFPPDSVNREHLQPSETRTRCFWKGTASYYDVVVDGQRNRDAAWYYPEPAAAAREIAGYIAFWHGVKVRRVKTADEAQREPVGSGGGGWLRRLLRA